MEEVIVKEKNHFNILSNFWIKILAIIFMTIDHVGIGSDFDGDGGIIGCNDSSELINFTRRLLFERYSEQDIQKIWGGNFLRIMEEVQKQAGR